MFTLQELFRCFVGALSVLSVVVASRIRGQHGTTRRHCVIKRGTYTQKRKELVVVESKVGKKIGGIKWRSL